ncbi:SDR family NAD(P)-dependent oxidoreductase [Seongchinamella unica]|uniref:SDR family NAD(P)-dependent oxidoreductase n=1 Tax=Seongchinamella unica TaxID=2547392 RepID=A0A4R5LN38_9GAMM|nr:SDR family NAD(P)-dependent oxidoreductase [Seongchinamella unica]TDG11364.1 SDR family NAD(P)-dependent oxidoreductase [Seongchinamella unica]
MLDLEGKTAVISGGAGGIGFNLGMTLGKAGMNIVLADIEEPQLASAESALRDAGIEVLAVAMDVALREDWARTAEVAVQRFGSVHMLVNNAGVGGGIGALETLDEPGWRWAIDVNLMGVVYGANTFIPLLKEHGESAWLINVASMAGMAGAPLGGAYTATKAAVVALSESWHDELKNTPVQVSVLAPAFVKTRIHLSHRNRQARYAPVSAPTPDVLHIAKVTAKAVENGIDVEVVGARVLEALEQGELYIFTHPNYSVVPQQRSAAIAAAFERAAQSPILEGISDQEVTRFDR